MCICICIYTLLISIIVYIYTQTLTGVVGDEGREGRKRHEARAEGTGEPLQRALAKLLKLLLLLLD